MRVALYLLVAFAVAGLAAGQGIYADAKTLEDSRDDRERRAAVQRIARHGSFQAWAILMGKALPDREPMVADEAQLAMGEILLEDTADLLFGRHVLGDRDTLLRLRGAEVLGRVQARTNAERWKDVLKERDARVRRTLLSSLGDQLQAGRITGKREALIKLVGRTVRTGKDPLVEGLALMALAELDPVEAREEALEFARDDEPAKRIAAFATWMVLDPESAETHAVAVLDDTATGVRSIAVEVLEAVGTKSAAEEIVGRLDREHASRIRAQVCDTLRRMSGLRHGADPRPWRDWLAELDDDWRSEPSVESGDEENRGDVARTTTFAGHNVRSDRVAFLIDMSGSMWEEVGGKTRKERVGEKLAKALRDLPERASFAIVPYADEPAPFERGLVQATERNVKKAIDRFERLTLRGKGNAWGAIERALEIPGVDTLVILTDGAPSGGERWNVELMALLWERENRLRRVALDVVLFGARKSLVRHWRAMSEDGGGRLTEIEL